MSDTWINTLVWGGAGITLVGLALLMLCIARVARAKQATLSEDDLAAMLQSVVPLNLGGLCLSALGLIMVVTGLVLS